MLSRFPEGMTGRKSSGGLTVEAELARGALGAEAFGEVDGGAGAGGDGGKGEESAEGEEALRFVEAEARA
jgi:hypothetical protein